MVEDISPEKVDAVAGSASVLQSIRDVLGDNHLRLMSRWADDIREAAEIVGESHGIPVELAAILTARVAVEGVSVLRDMMGAEAKQAGYSIPQIGPTVLPGKSSTNTYRTMPYLRDAAAAIKTATDEGAPLVATVGPWRLRVLPVPSEPEQLEQDKHTEQQKQDALGALVGDERKAGPRRR